VDKKTVERYYAAWNSLNTDAPASFYAKEAELVFFDVLPMQYSGWAEYKAGVQKIFFDQISGGKLVPNDDLQITKRGNVAWMTLTFHLSFTQKTGAAVELDCRHTAIWEKRGARWLIVHEHISVPLTG
jgi:ketosteroid isomerase-like protein